MIDQYPSANGVLTSLIWRKTAAGGETSLSGYDNASQALSYTPGQEQVYLNGILLVRGDDYTATNGTSITGLAALAESDFIQINCYNNFSVASTPSTSIVGTIANNQLANSVITINGSAISLGGSVTLAGDIESVTAGTGISGGGSSGAVTVTNSMATAINAKGDLIVGTADNAFDRLAVSPNSGDTIVADSSQATGLRYQAPKTQNAIYNSGFDIAQRGTSFTALAAADYTLDRWVMWSTTASQSNYVSQQSVGNLSVTPNQAIRFCGRFGRTAGTTNTGGRQIFQTLETADSVRFAGQTVTFSFYARAGANYSSVSNSLGFALSQGTGTDQIYHAFTGANNTIGSSATLTTSFQRFTVTGTVLTTTTELAPYFYWSPVGTAGAADYLEITGLQLEVGSVATPFNRQNATIQGELAACQRYYYRANSAGGAYTIFALGYTDNTTSALVMIPVPSYMRVFPTSIDYANLAFQEAQGGIFTFTAISLNGGSGATAPNNNIQFQITGASGMTIGRPGRLLSHGVTNGHLGFSAEL